ncbi:MAG: hypothetical protein QNK04_04895 [Myxococcota bacterium]|nr:hypothetical protein [Myxococcota bacterium]
MTPPRWIESGETVELREGEGLLVLHISTNVELSRLSFGLGGSIQDVPEGEHIELFVARAGSYRWTQIRITGRDQPRFRVQREDDWRFRIEAGRINYVGLLELERTDWLRLSGRTIDRSALAMESLRARHPALIERYPLVYNGPGQNVFFEHLRAAAGEVGSAGSEAAAARP